MIIDSIEAFSAAHKSNGNGSLQFYGEKVAKFIRQFYSAYFHLISSLNDA